MDNEPRKQINDAIIGKIKPKLGMEFLHATWLNNKNQPMRCRITALRKGVIYWRPVAEDGSLGAPMYFDATQFPNKAKEIL
ncbi:hypothetical protein [Ferrovum sp.]|uniref:hypothetical protein n=1 Tax=Ferrovum sp. TaxID=2609467 RepID=UPI00262C28EA|nr:hypothetical protein [Ferrovum sp.]